MGVFHAYVHNIQTDITWRLVIAFASRAVADEWWRAIFLGGNNLLSANVQRIEPQFYTHRADVVNLYNFFNDVRLADVAEQFRGRMFLTLQNDLVGRGISIIPPQEITDHISGKWFYIRSKVDRGLFWAYDGRSGQISASKQQRTSFRVTARTSDVPEGTVMIGKDLITIRVAQRPGSATAAPHVNVNADGILVPSGVAKEFRFADFEAGRFAVNGSDGALLFDSDGLRSDNWVLV